MAKAVAINGKITMGCFIEALAEADKSINAEEAEGIRGYYTHLGTNANYLNNIRKGIIPPDKTGYTSVMLLARNRLIDLRDMYVKNTGKKENTFLTLYLEQLSSHDVNIGKYKEKLETSGFNSVVKDLSDDLELYINDLFDTSGSKKILREYPIRLLINYDDESVLGNVNKVIENIQKDNANPIIIDTQYKTGDAGKYDIYYVIVQNNIPRSVIDIIKELPNHDGYPRIRIFRGDGSFRLDEDLLSLCTKRDIKIKLFNDTNVYKYDIYSDLREIIEERNQQISDYIEERNREISTKLRRSQNYEIVESIDFKLLQDPINLYDKKSNYFRLFIDEYLSERRQIARNFPDKAQEIYPELIELAKEHDIQMDVLFDYAKLIIENKGNDRLAIKYAEQYRLYKEYRNEINEDSYELFLFLGVVYDNVRNLDKAVFCYSKAQELIPDENKEDIAKIISLRASALWATGRYIEAEDYVDKNIASVESCYKKNPGDYIKPLAKIYKTKGDILHARRDLEKARIYLIKAIKVWNKDKNFDEIGNFDIEKVDLSNLEAEDRNTVTAICNNLGIINRRRKNYEESIKYYDYCISIRKAVYEQNAHVDKYARSYAMIISNKADLQWRMGIGLGKASPIEVTRLYDEAIRLKNLANDKKTYRYYYSLYFTYNEYARFCIMQKYWDGAEESLSKAKECIQNLKDIKNDNSYDRLNAEFKFTTALFEMERLDEKEKPSEECGKLLKSSFVTYENLSNLNNGFYLEDVVQTGIALLRYYQYSLNNDEMDVDSVYGTTLAAASDLAKKHDVYKENYDLLKDWQK